ncbi:MAG TPA: sarcosine oxidase subunit delta [Methylovirgula sp.]|nr:sarcosine oxidase subunit delta [Methylovirgula sp.]
MRIPCPFCGLRDSSEFVTIGEASMSRPPADAPEAQIFDYVYLRDNPAGVNQELWYHAQGCRSWLKVARDTRTHEIESAVLARGGAQ